MHDDEELPTEEDMEKLSSGLDEKVRERTDKLSQEKSMPAWRDLAEAVLSRLIVFNGKRGSETAQMTLENYAISMQVTKNFKGSIYASLTEDEREYAGRHHIVRVKGKRNKVNDVLFTDELKESADLLIDSRAECGILESNKFVFATPGYSGNLQSTVALKNFKEEYGVVNMETRKIRKLFATVVQAKPDAIEIRRWARQFGHTEGVHIDTYRYGMHF